VYRKIALKLPLHLQKATEQMRADKSRCPGHKNGASAKHLESQIPQCRYRVILEQLNRGCHLVWR
jgi:hypothetical protein